jgi:predicted cation transporter
MWPIIGAAAACMLILAVELPAMRKGKQYKQMAVFFILTVTSVTLYTLEVLHVRLPNPIAMIAQVYKNLGLTLGK